VDWPGDPVVSAATLPRQHRPPSRWRQALVTVFASVWLLAASAAAVADWSRIEVDGFTFTGDVDERRLKAIASDLRLFRYAIGRYITTVG
jgi:hypothetical protein